MNVTMTRPIRKTQKIEVCAIRIPEKYKNINGGGGSKRPRGCSSWSGTRPCREDDQKNKAGVV